MRSYNDYYLHKHFAVLRRKKLLHNYAENPILLSIDYGVWIFNDRPRYRLWRTFQNSVCRLNLVGYPELFLKQLIKNLKFKFKLRYVKISSN